jgi:hypothetical protein
MGGSNYEDILRAREQKREGLKRNSKGSNLAYRNEYEA